MIREGMRQKMSKRRDLRLFERRFKQKLNLSKLKDDEDFFKSFVDDIKLKYTEKVTEKSNNGDTHYAIREIQRLELEIEEEERTSHKSVFMPIFYSSVITIAIFMLGSIPNNHLNVFKLAVENSLKNITDQEKMFDMINIYKDVSNEINNDIIKSSMYILILFTFALVILEIIDLNNRYRRNKRIRFNKICIGVLKGIQEEKTKILS